MTLKQVNTKNNMEHFNYLNVEKKIIYQYLETIFGYKWTKDNVEGNEEKKVHSKPMTQNPLPSPDLVQAVVQLANTIEHHPTHILPNIENKGCLQNAPQMQIFFS